jgi:hypothetical protein
MAKQWNKRPSEIIGILQEYEDIDGGYTAYCFDEACGHFGNYVSQAMDEAMEKSKSKNEAQKRGAADNVLRRYLGLPQKFRDIGQAARAKKEPRPDPPFRMEP